MSATVIRVENLGKKYIIGHQNQEPYTALRDVIANGVKSLARKFGRRNSGRSNEFTEEFWALKDVSFDIEQGDRVGIIGRNGAGKSTLLKILSRITEPTTGSIRIKGRVASLLEVGTGFHPELTGRENIYLNGSILGMSRVEIKSKFDEIVAFAEIEKFLDTPVKRYSSGMYVRLAFAVAAHLEPEILVVDEVLAVGDTEFQKKCLGKMKDVSTKEGRTILFVSHNMAAIRALSLRAIVLDKGKVLVDGDVESAVSAYIGSQTGSVAVFTWSETDPLNQGEFAFRRAAVLNRHGQPVELLSHDEPFSISIEYEVRGNIRGLIVGFLMLNNEGVEVCGSDDFHAKPSDGLDPNRYISRCDFPPYLLNQGRYHLKFGADAPNGRIDERSSFCLSFAVEDTEKHGDTRYELPGVLRPKLDWSVEAA